MTESDERQLVWKKMRDRRDYLRGTKNGFGENRWVDFSIGILEYYHLIPTVFNKTG